MEKRRARNWYWWLWLSPLLTVPSALFLVGLDPGRAWICGGNWRNCDYSLAGRVSGMVAVLGSALWHLVLLRPASNKDSQFVRWHGRQALLLAGVRTAVPLVFVLVFEYTNETLLFIPVLIAVWFFGTLWGQPQATRGDCSLMRWFGRAAALPSPETTTEGTTPVEELDPEALVDIIRCSHDPEQRRRALLELENLGMVEPL